MQPLLVVTLALAWSVAGNDPATCPQHAEHTAQREKDQRFLDTKDRGARAMGFDQDRTTHNFVKHEDGGAIEVTVNDPKDAVNLAAIRKHLRQVAKDFAQGDFRSPLATHAELPAGAAAMQAAKDKITYRYEELPGGARVRIATADPDARRAVHEFLGYQVREHRTGDQASEHKH